MQKSDPLGLDDYFTQLDIDLVGWTGVEISLGYVIDTDTPLDSGYYISLGNSVGANVGVGVGGGWVCRDIEGPGYNYDVNVGAYSVSPLFDDKGPNGVSGSWGPGGGANGSVGNTYTLSFNTILNLFR
jgi:hypothetical protein